MAIDDKTVALDAIDHMRRRPQPLAGVQLFGFRFVPAVARDGEGEVIGHVARERELERWKGKRLCSTSATKPGIAPNIIRFIPAKSG
jgi:hypothetical protein